MKLLIIDDEPAIVETVDMKLRKEGFTTFTADSAEEGMRLYRRVKPDLIILDIMLPQRSGLDFCRAVRRDSATPIIMISAKSEEGDRVKGLEIGADDYLVKPFSLGELLARVKAVLRRSSGEPVRETIERGELKIDPRGVAWWEDAEPLAKRVCAPLFPGSECRTGFFPRGVARPRLGPGRLCVRKDRGRPHPVAPDAC